MTAYFVKCAQKFNRLLIVFVLVNIVGCFLSIIYPILLYKVIENINIIGTKEMLCFVILSFANPMWSILRDYLQSYLIIRLQSYTTVELISSLLEKDKFQLQKFNSNEIVRNCSTYSWMLNDFFLSSVIQTSIDLLKALLIIFILVKIDVYITLFILISCIFRLVVVDKLSEKIKSTYPMRFKSNSQFRSCLSSYISKTKMIITRAKKDEVVQILRKLGNSAKENNEPFSKLQANISTIDMTGGWIIQLLTIVFCSILSNYKTIHFETIFLAYSYTSDICDSFMNVSNSIRAYKNLKSQFNLVKEYLDLDCISNEGIYTKFKEVSVKNVSFCYDDKQWIVNNVNYLFKSGQVNLIIGENGTGKTTLFYLLTGQYTPSDGEILIDNINLENFNKKKYQSELISVLTQSDKLFEGTIKDNLIYSGAEKILKEFGEIDLNKEINCENDNISGGEKRKILLARVFAEIELKNPCLIIFDEPFYALEKATREIVKKKIEHLSKQKIVICISHNYETINQDTNCLEL